MPWRAPLPDEHPHPQALILAMLRSCLVVRPAVAVEWADRVEPRHFDKVFGLFQRLHLQSEYDGAGMGLPIAKKAAEEHGGKLWVDSSPGQGSVFRFTLPKPAEAPRRLGREAAS